MKVKELIERLEDFNPEAEVHFSYTYGDYWRTEVAPKVYSLDEGMIVYSDYHQMDKLIEDDSDENEVKKVVVIS